MTQPQQNLLAGFNYADPSSAGEYLPKLILEEGKSALVSFLKTVPMMQEPPIVYCRVHWNSEMGEKGRRYQCFGGQCCEQVTWQKGFGGQPGKFAPNKAVTRYFIPCVVYEQDPVNQTQMRATIKYADFTWVAYNSLCTAIANTNEGLDFWSRDVVVTMKKVNGATDYTFDKRESQAQWQTNPLFKQQVEEQLPKVAERLLASMPKMMTEAEFLAMKPELDAKVHAAQQSNLKVAQQAPQAQFGQLPTGQFGQLPPGFMPQQPAQQQFTQPQVNIPIAQPTQEAVTQPQVEVAQPQFTQPQVNIPVVQPTQEVVTQPQVEVAQPQFTQPQVNIPAAQPVQEAVAQPQVEVPVIQPVQEATSQPEISSISLDFDPSKLLK